MRATLLAGILAVAMSIPAVAQSGKSEVFLTPHDIGGNGCATCHVPHQSGARGEVLLWVQAFTQVATFGVYSEDLSPSLDADLSGAEIGGAFTDANLPSGASSGSVLCMSCHDGAITTIILGEDPVAPLFMVDANKVGSVTISDGLQNDHPINFTYDEALALADGGLATPDELTGTVAGMPLYSNTLQCATCHDPHDQDGPADTAAKYLRIPNANNGTGLCVQCHL